MIDNDELNENKKTDTWKAANQPTLFTKFVTVIIPVIKIYTFLSLLMFNLHYSRSFL